MSACVFWTGGEPGDEATQGPSTSSAVSEEGDVADVFQDTSDEEIGDDDLLALISEEGFMPETQSKFCLHLIYFAVFKKCISEALTGWNWKRKHNQLVSQLHWKFQPTVCKS